MEKFNIIGLAKQVPDTRQVGKDAMNADGTINRAALPAVFNPEDLNALEQALAIKDRFPGSTVTMLTMGPERAKEIVMVCPVNRNPQDRKVRYHYRRPSGH